MGVFNYDILCEDCEVEEHGAPGYETAKIVEAREAAAGNTNYAGVGLSDADKAYLGLEEAYCHQEVERQQGCPATSPDDELTS